MNPEVCSSSSVLFHMLSSDLNASMATADDLSREFDSLMKECSSDGESQLDTVPSISREIRQTSPKASSPTSSKSEEDPGSPRPPSNAPTLLVTDASPRSQSSLAYDSKSLLSPFPVFSPPCQLTPPLSRNGRLSPSCGLQSLSRQAPSPQARKRIFQYDTVPRDRPGSPFLERSSPPCPSPLAMDQSFHLRPHPSPMSPYPSSTIRSPRTERRTAPHLLAISHSGSLPRSFGSQNQTASPTARRKIPAEWSENDVDMAYGRKPQHLYEKAERLRAYGSLESPPPGFSKFQPQSSLPRNIRLNPLHPERSSSPAVPLSPYGSPTLSRNFCPPPSVPRPRWHHPVPLSVIMRAQRPLGVLVTRHPRVMELEGDGSPYLQHALLHPGQTAATEQRQPARQGPEKEEGGLGATPRPRSPTSLPALAPDAPGCPELLLLRSEIPRALKRRGSLTQPLPLVHRRQYQQMIHKLFSRKDLHHKGEPGSESSSSSEGEESPKAAAASLPIPVLVTSQHKGLQSILKRPLNRRRCRHRARLNPLVLLLDGALIGELDTVQRAVREMSDPSQPNEEGVTALHNAICGGHYSIVDFLVQIGANVSAPDSHGWTPLHCAAACNDRSMCEYLVRSGAAVLSVTEGDGATAVEKCDPYAAGFEECTAFLRGVEEAMGVENGGVLYALWEYPAQAPDELSFLEGDTVTVKNKQGGAEWWRASLGNREGFVPSNYFALFPKVRQRSLLDQNQKGR
ncbi:relA-associated inhibitor-like [Conger conger]|uniref:relA-associated inhibitor-like n=1 Tax=Conger conger TaxID=82655 RepID=UPI002A5A13FD|nr:relA-associated inhibitor-like [Conger conger]